MKAEPGPGEHVGSETSTTKNSTSRTVGGDLGVIGGGKHTLSGAGNVRTSANPTDTTRAFVNVGVDGSYGRTHQTTTASSTETKHEFSLEGSAERFGYPVTYHVMIGRQDADHPTTVLNTGPDSPHADRTATVEPHGGQLIVAQHPPAPAPDTPPPRNPALVRLPQAHFIGGVDGPSFRTTADQALGSAFGKGGVHGKPSDVPGLLDVLGSADQLRGAVSASHNGWANTGDEHVGGTLDQHTAGLSTRARLSDFQYQETLSGEGKLTIESTSKTSTTVDDKWSGGVKGSAGPDVGRFPEAPTGVFESSYQIRGGAKIKGGYGPSGGDSVKHEMSTVRTLATPKGTWHVYQAKADITTVGRVTDTKGHTTYGDPQRTEHTVHVLLSDSDVRALADGTEPPPAEPRTAPLLDQGVSGGAFVHILSSDEILAEIDRQLHGPRPAGEPPLRALPFADTYSPHNLNARSDDVMGKGVLASHVDESRGNRVITQVLVRGVSRAGWRDDNAQSESEISRKVTASQTVTGSSGKSGSLGADGNLRISYRAPEGADHINSATYNPAASVEGSLSSGAKSGITTSVDHKTSGFGTNHKFSNHVQYEVTVSQRNSSGRFINLSRPPAPADTVWRTEAWVPEPLTRQPAADHAPAAVQPPQAHPAPAPHPAGGPAGAPQGAASRSSRSARRGTTSTPGASNWPRATTWPASTIQGADRQRRPHAHHAAPMGRRCPGPGGFRAVHRRRDGRRGREQGGPFRHTAGGGRPGPPGRRVLHQRPAPAGGQPAEAGTAAAPADRRAGGGPSGVLPAVHAGRLPPAQHPRIRVPDRPVRRGRQYPPGGHDGPDRPGRGGQHPRQGKGRARQ